MKLNKKSRGFTLIELVVVVGILITVGAILLNTLVIVLRVAIKTNTLTEVRQNGGYALSQITKMLRDAKSFQGVSTDGTSFSTNCVVSTPLAGTLTPTPPAYKSIKITTYTDNEVIFSCTPTTIASNGASLLNTRAVAIATCSFSCLQNTILESPTIGIHFSLTQYTPTGTILLPERTASASAIPFETSVTLRNVSK